MYYEGAWMRHKAHGPGMVAVSGQTLYFYRYPNGRMESDPLVVEPEMLQIWWPRSGSYNTPGGAIYIARKAVRSMRKSAHAGEHYVIRWGKERMPRGSNVMLALRAGHSLVDLDFALRAIKEKMTKSVAVTRDIILAKTPDGLAVVFRGIKVGMLEDEDFVPDHPRSPIALRVTQKMQEESIL
jgi:hypothetical protein